MLISILSSVRPGWELADCSPLQLHKRGEWQLQVAKRRHMEDVYFEPRRRKQFPLRQEQHQLCSSSLSLFWRIAVDCWTSSASASVRPAASPTVCGCLHWPRSPWSASARDASFRSAVRPPASLRTCCRDGRKRFLRPDSVADPSHGSRPTNRRLRTRTNALVRGNFATDSVLVTWVNVFGMPSITRSVTRANSVAVSGEVDPWPLTETQLKNR